MWRCSNGKFLYWFHNHGGPAIKMAADFSGRSGSPYDDRNPAWLVAGREQDSPDGKVIHWSQPEILLYDDDPLIRMSYPDLVEDGGKFFVNETQMNVGRVHEIPSKLVEGLFNQYDNKTVVTEGLVLDLPGDKPMPREIRFSPTLRRPNGSPTIKRGKRYSFRIFKNFQGSDRGVAVRSCLS